MTDYILYRIYECSGCEYEDGSDTRKTEVSFALVEGSKIEAFEDYMADRYGCQDYSYQISYKAVCEFSLSDLKSIHEEIKKALEEHEE